MSTKQAFHEGLLAADEPPACCLTNPAGSSNFLIVVDHASARIPRCLDALGLPAAELSRHIAWDIGALAVAEKVARLLDAALIAQNYSRLVIDCNRDPEVDSSIPVLSEYTKIPGNRGLSAADRAARRRAIFDPYHDCIRRLLDQRAADGRLTILIAQHTMTDIFRGKTRAMHAAVLYNRDRRFAGLTLEALRTDSDLVIADNEPYFVSDATDYTIPHHGEARSLPHVEIELRQDLVTAPAGQQEWSQRLVTALRSAEQEFLQQHCQVARRP